MSFHKPINYSNKKIVLNGLKFDSKTEAEYYSELCRQLRYGLITALKVQPKVYLTDSKILYKPDFLITRNNEEIYVDVKGFVTPVFAIKKRLWKFYGLGKLELVKKVRGSFIIYEAVTQSVKNN